MRSGQVSGFQIAFFIYATWLLVVPLSIVMGKLLELAPAEQATLDRYDALVVAGLGLLLISPLRRGSGEALRRPMANNARREALVMAAVIALLGFAWAGGCALWWDFTGGPVLLERQVSAMGTHDAAMARALNPATAMVHVMIGIVLGPIIEEIVFRRFLYEAWSHRFGWLLGMLLSSIVFASLHPNFIPAFAASLLCTCVYRRTGSLRGSVLVHAANNLVVSYPVLGRWMFPRELDAPGDLQSWTFHVACLLVVLVIWPTYIWMSRDRNDELPIQLEEDHVALPR
jgi:membrane protease YdiL (CAAX protease family)